LKRLIIAFCLSLFSFAVAEADTGSAVVDAVRSRLPEGARDMKITARRTGDPLESPFELYVLSFEKGGKDYGSNVVPVLDGKFLVMGDVRDMDSGVDLSVIWQALTTKADIPADEDHLVSGDPSRCTIPVAVFSDYQCPYCRNFAPIVRTLAENDPDLCLYHYNFPLDYHQDAEQFARYAVAWRILTGRPVPVAYWSVTSDRDKAEKWIEAELKKTGTDSKRFWKLVASREVEKRIRSDIDFAQRIRAGGTPTVFVSGHRIPAKKEMIENFTAWKKGHPAVDSLEAET
jgi:protein-disulfide isomerase